MSSGTENDFSCEQFMALQPQFSVEMMNQINLATLCKSALTSMFYYIYTAISPSCRKKHAERLTALGMQRSDDTRKQTAAAAGKESQRFVEQTVVLFLCHVFRLEHFHHMCPK